jgi:hypothetical protein
MRIPLFVNRKSLPQRGFLNWGAHVAGVHGFGGSPKSRRIISTAGADRGSSSG